MKTLYFAPTALMALLTTAFLASCSEAPAPAPETPAPIVQEGQLRFPQNHPQLALLGIATAAPSRAITTELPARLVWNEERTQRVYPAFAGRVTSIRADVGQSVKAGAVLAQIASPDFGVAQADAAKAQADVNFTQKALQRQKELLDAGIIARKEYEQTQADAARAQAEASRATARTQLYGSSNSVNQQLAITASLGGIVVERNLNPGQELRPDQSGIGVPALFLITDPTKLWVQIDAREAEVGTLKPGAAFTLVVPSLNGKSFEGKVIATADAIDPNTRTIKIRGVVDNSERLLKAEMLASARIERQLGSGVVLPAGVAILRGAKHYVFVQSAPGTFEQREVQLGYQGPEDIVVSRGLEVGEKVVSENLLLLARQFRLAQEDTQIAASGKSNTATGVVSKEKAVAKP